MEKTVNKKYSILLSSADFTGKDDIESTQTESTDVNGTDCQLHLNQPM
jgi:hypothetical protein